ncbi:unnamed protein product [Lampetra fluviatilis]
MKLDFASWASLTLSEHKRVVGGGMRRKRNGEGGQGGRRRSKSARASSVTHASAHEVRLTVPDSDDDATDRSVRCLRRRRRVVGFTIPGGVEE